MNTRKQIETLFADYEQTPELADFMEEMESNLNDRISALQRKGLAQEAAIQKALAELGDVSTLANELGQKKKQEVYSEMYMKTRSYISARRGALYALCYLMLGAAVLIPLIVWFSSGMQLDAVATLLPFGTVGVLGLVYLGLTQETAAREAMRPKRAIWYVLAAALICFGIVSSLIVYTSGEHFAAEELAAHGGGANASLASAISVLLVFALPGAALGIFLALTEKDRKKPWMKKQIAESAAQMKSPFSSQVSATRFGLFSGALWIAAVAAFLVLSITVGFTFSWLALAAALILQLLLLAAMTKNA